MRQFVRFVDRLSDACAVAAAVMLVSATLIVCWMVAYRALGNSTFWEIELATYLIVAAVLVGSPFCLKTRGHIGVDLVSEWLPPRGRRVLLRVLAVLGFVVCVYLTWVGFELTLEAWRSQETSGTAWDPPRWPFFATMPLGLGLTALQYVADFLRRDDEPDASAKAISGQGA
ncbi:MAG: TRAP transporter small permease subunit [Burkholderiales bacterium]|mgnify:CR=1 FL=1